MIDREMRRCWPSMTWYWGAVLDEDERAEEVRRVRVGAGVLKVVDELFDVLRLPRVRALERRDGELVIGSEHFAQGFFRRADRHIDRHPSLITFAPQVRHTVF